ncbi:MAG: phospholipase D-like domain-containing protein [Bacteroidota bacterium]
MYERSIIVFPDDTVKAIIDAINNADKSLLIKMFLFSDPDLIHAVIAAKDRDVKVKVMLNPARRNGEEENKEARTILEAAGIEVRDTNPEFIITHEKSMVVDDRLAFVKSLNWETRNLTETRDYAIITSHPREVDEIKFCFEADWLRQPFDPVDGASLIWCSLNGRERIARFIDHAQHTLFMQNERFQDLVIIERIVRAAARGVKVHVMVPSPHNLKLEKLVEGVGGLRIMDDVGIKIHKLKHLRLHGKMLLADGCRAIVGSINLAPGSFDHRRELAIELHDVAVVERLQKIAHHDWKHSHPLDLTDEGLFEDLELHGQGGSEKLVLDLHRKKDTEPLKKEKKNKKHKKH